jgi:hypothetical protein
LPEGLRDAASVAYAQMPRPRSILALGAGDLAPLPAADITADLVPRQRLCHQIVVFDKREFSAHHNPQGG